ncbi:hypothetical protein F4808DRAFT_458682 [Astrocystis sublimbata]|nr:hypothetical protein F4808DRAFT_458682 [Astrocystis sublimbata]
MAGLDNLPLEVLEDIVNLAVSSRLKGQKGRLASVNPLWQSVVEKQTFQELWLPASEAGELMEILQHRPERFGLVRRLIVVIKLPPYTAADCSVIESAEDRFRNDLAFTKAMNALLGHLSTWPSTGRTFELQLLPASPSDARYIDGHQWIRNEFGIVPGDLLHNRAWDSVLELYGKPKTAPIPAVTRFTFRDDCERYMSAAGVEFLFRTFPRLKDVYVRFRDNPSFARRVARRRMANALDIMPGSVSSMRFYLDYYPPANQIYRGEVLCKPDESDTLTRAYRNATQKMIFVDAHGMLGTPELFWPKEVDAANPAPFWPDLKYMELYYHIVEPTGEWLFEADDSESPRVQADLPLHNLPAEYTPSHDLKPQQHRFTGKRQKMDKFYLAMVKAVKNMPKLQHLRVQALTYWSGVISPLHVFTFERDDKFGRATWSGTPPFEPGAHVIKAWRKMAYNNHMVIVLETKDGVTSTTTQL